MTVDVGSPFPLAIGSVAEKGRLEAAVGLQSTNEPAQPITIETIVLAALQRGPKLPEAISCRLGLNLLDVNEALLKLRDLSWIDGHNQLTDRGRIVLHRLARPSAAKLLPKSRNGHYFPKSLRVPRDV